MALTYSKFDSTPATIVADLKAAILASSDWADISPTSGFPSTTLTVSAAAAATSFTVASTAGMSAGMAIVFEPGTPREEYRVINTVTSGTVFTLVAAMSPTYAHASGSVVRFASVVLKATTTRGAQMVIDLVDGGQYVHALQPAFCRTHNGTYGGGVDRTTTRNLVWRSNATSASWTMPLHCKVSASKEHLFISIEGPKAWENGATSTQYGSLRNYIFMADLVPYHAADTVPAVVAFAATTTNGPVVAYQNHLAHISRNFANNSSWTPVRIGTLQFPTSGTATESMNLKNQCAIDGNRYQFPFVVFDENEGIRGRLNRIYYVGQNQPAVSWDQGVVDSDTVPFEGLTYGYHQLNASDASTAAWGALGSCNNASAATQNRSHIVAIPIA